MPTATPLLNDAAFSLLAGGRHHCDPAWNKPADGIDQCYKLYYPLRGQARLVLATQTILVRPGYVYLIPGYHLLRQECRRQMDVYWVHFVPESLYLTFLLSHVAEVQTWSRAALEYWHATCMDIPRVFAGGRRGPFYRLQAMLLDLVARVLEKCQLDHAAAVAPTFEQLRPAIAYMDQRLLDTPKLAEIAKQAHLAPNYFHRKFTAAFHVTPFNYMLRRRLNLGRQLLLSGDLTLERIAERCGFSSAFHFSKLFKKHCGFSPRQFRLRALP
jgi:AraC-like DNA-binding protein